MTELRQRIIEDMPLRGLAEGTQQVYVEAVKHLAAHSSRSPDQLTEDEVRDFILHLTETKKLATSTVRVHLFAIKFLYRMTLQRNWPVLSLARVKKPNRLLVILSRQEARHLLSLIRRPQARMSCVWTPSRPDYLVPVKALSKIFRGIFMDLARKALPNRILPMSVWKQSWVVYSKATTPGADHVLDYLGRSASARRKCHAPKG